MRCFDSLHLASLYKKSERHTNDVVVLFALSLVVLVVLHRKYQSVVFPLYHRLLYNSRYMVYGIWLYYVYY